MRLIALVGTTPSKGASLSVAEFSKNQRHSFTVKHFYLYDNATFSKPAKA